MSPRQRHKSTTLLDCLMCEARSPGSQQSLRVGCGPLCVNTGVRIQQQGHKHSPPGTGTGISLTHSQEHLKNDKYPRHVLLPKLSKGACQIGEVCLCVVSTGAALPAREKRGSQVWCLGWGVSSDFSKKSDLVATFPTCLYWERGKGMPPNQT